MPLFTIKRYMEGKLSSIHLTAEELRQAYTAYQSVESDIFDLKYEAYGALSGMLTDFPGLRGLPFAEDLNNFEAIAAKLVIENDFGASGIKTDIDKAACASAIAIHLEKLIKTNLISAVGPMLRGPLPGKALSALFDMAQEESEALRHEALTMASNCWPDIPHDKDFACLIDDNGIDTVYSAMHNAPVYKTMAFAEALVWPRIQQDAAVPGNIDWVVTSPDFSEKTTAGSVYAALVAANREVKQDPEKTVEIYEVPDNAAPALILSHEAHKNPDAENEKDECE